MQPLLHPRAFSCSYQGHHVMACCDMYSLTHAGYLGAILFEQDLEQPLLGQTLTVTSLVDIEGAALRQHCGSPARRQPVLDMFSTFSD